MAGEAVAVTSLQLAAATGSTSSSSSRTPGQMRKRCQRRGSCSGRPVLRSLLEGGDLALATAFTDPCTGGALVWARFACAQLRLRYIEGTEGRRGAVPLLLPCGLAPKWACIA